jgi:ABC-type Fe3+-hydroxamate transport system substrate-binding protein
MTEGSRIRAGAVASLLALVALLAAGCGQRSEPTGSTVALYPVTVDDQAGPAPVSLQEKPAHVAVLDREAQRILRALGAPAALAADGNGNPRTALLERSQPSLLVAGPSNDSLQLRRLHERVPAPLYVVGGDSIAAVQRSILDLGLLTDTAVRARQLAASITAAEEKSAARAGSGERPSVFVDLGFLATTGSRSYIGDLLRMAGATDVVGASSDPGPLTPEHVARLDPQIWLASSDAGTSLAQLRKDPVLKKVAAIKAGRFAVVPAELLQPGPGVAAALAQVAAAIHAGTH